VAVDLRRLPWVRRLATDYVFEYAKLEPFFAGDPRDTTSWSAAIERRLDRAATGSAVASVVAAQQARRNAPLQSVASAARLAQPRTLAIVTGQQAGLFGGPLFTLLKAITTVRLAERIGREHDVTVVPIFWIDAEDHDWNEVSACAVLDNDLVLQRISADPPEGAGERMVGALAWTDRIEDARAALGAVLPAGEFTSWLLEFLDESYRPGHGVADGFARLLERLLGPHGLVVYDASDPAAKPLLAPLFAEELRHAGRTSLLAARAGADLVGRGYHMQVTPHADHAALFAIDGGRRPIRSAGEQFAIGDDDAVARETLIDRAFHEPWAFSANVLLRPIVQDTLFPTIAYVAGPNELAYLAQLRGVYESFDVPMPLMVGRATATLVDSAALRFVTRHDVAFESLRDQDEHALNELLRTLLPPSVERSIDEAERALAERMEAVIAALPEVDPTLEGKGRSILGRMQHELQTLRAKVLQAAKRRDETLRRQFLHARAQAFPDGEPQERIVSGVSFLARYGPALIDRLFEELPLEMGTHWVIAV
jgi:bacillithiol biosynthesis cysteine-adding enzyme BshC